MARWCHAGGLVEVACFSVSAGYLKVFDLGTGIRDVGARRRYEGKYFPFQFVLASGRESELPRTQGS